MKGAKSTKKQFISAVSSFYSRNYVDFPRDPNFRVKADNDSVICSLPRDELRTILLKASPTYRVVFAVMTVGFMGYKEFNIFNRSEDVRQQVLEDGDLIKAEFPGRKGGKPFYTFVGGDGLKALRSYLEDERGPLRRGEALVLNQQGNPITRSNIRRVFTGLAAECGFIDMVTPKCPKCGGKTKSKRRTVETIEGNKRRRGYACCECGHWEPVSDDFRVPKSVRYRVKPHELRDTAKTLWYRSGTPEKWMADFFSGRTQQVAPNDYLKSMKLYPDWMEETYRQVLPWLNILREDPEKVPVRDVRRMQRR